MNKLAKYGCLTLVVFALIGAFISTMESSMEPEIGIKRQQEKPTKIVNINVPPVERPPVDFWIKSGEKVLGTWQRDDFQQQIIRLVNADEDLYLVSQFNDLSILRNRIINENEGRMTTEESEVYFIDASGKLHLEGEDSTIMFSVYGQ